MTRGARHDARRGRSRPLRLATVAAAALATGACGGPDEDFLSRVDRVCADEAAAFEELDREEDPREPSEFAAQIEAAVGIREQALSDLREIEPPADAEGPFEDYVSIREESLAVMRLAAQAAEQDDRESFDVAAAKLADLSGEASLAAAELGADACVEEAPE